MKREISIFFMKLTTRYYALQFFYLKLITDIFNIRFNNV